jgi:lipoprotein-releasing system permease protein
MASAPISNDGIRNWQDLLGRLTKQPHIVSGAPAIYEEVLISRGARAQGALLKGIVPAEERKVSDLLDNVKYGSADALKSEKNSQGPPTTLAEEVTQSLPPIILGKDMADSLGATVGSVVLVTSPQGELTPFGIVPKYQRFKVVGIFESGFYDYDSSWGLTRLSDAQQLFGLNDVVAVLEFKVDDIYKAPEIALELEKVAGPGFGSKNWMEQNQALFRALRLEKIVTFITIGLIVFVAALNILISLIMMVMEKTKDIAVLVSIGARRQQIRRIFMLQGVLVGVIGTLIGLVLGYGLAVAAGHYHWIRLSAEVYSIDYVPFAPRVIDGLVVSLVSIAISFIATIYPAMNASRVLPAEALRYE